MGKSKAANDAPSNVTPITASKGHPEPAVIIFGRDDAQKPHASWFAAADAELAEKAAGYMRLKILRVTSADIRAKALELPLGRVFASGRGFVPFTKMATYEALEAFGGAIEPPMPPEPETPAPLTATNTPQVWSEIGVGSLVLASVDESEPWYPAIVAEARGDDLFILKWRDFADDPEFPRRRDGLALLPFQAATAS